MNKGGDDGNTSPGVALVAYLRFQLDELENYLPLSASADPEAVHGARLALRRFRSASICFKPLLPALPADDVGRLRKLARQLGESRDAYVLAQRLTLALEARESWHRSEALHGSIDGLMARAAEQAAAVTALEAVPKHTTQRLQRLRATLDPSRQTPGTRREVTQALQARWERLQRLMEQSLADTPADRHNTDLHNVRKELKCLRYAAESVAAGYGAATLSILQPAIELQRLLGEHHDAVVSRLLVADTVRTHSLDARDAASLDELESRRQANAEAQYYRAAALNPVPAPTTALAY